VRLVEVVPVSGLGRRSSALEAAFKGRLVTSKGLRPLPRIRRGTLGRGCGREGSGALPLPRAAAVSTGLRVREGVLGEADAHNGHAVLAGR